jgi:hypothetical protein
VRAVGGHSYPKGSEERHGGYVWKRQRIENKEMQENFDVKEVKKLRDSFSLYTSIFQCVSLCDNGDDERRREIKKESRWGRRKDRGIA